MFGASFWCYLLTGKAVIIGCRSLVIVARKKTTPGVGTSIIEGLLEPLRPPNLREVFFLHRSSLLPYCAPSRLWPNFLAALLRNLFYRQYTNCNLNKLNAKLLVLARVVKPASIVNSSEGEQWATVSNSLDSGFFHARLSYESLWQMS
jgi:hypothetical protein